MSPNVGIATERVKTIKPSCDACFIFTAASRAACAEEIKFFSRNRHVQNDIDSNSDSDKSKFIQCFFVLEPPMHRLHLHVANSSVSKKLSYRGDNARRRQLRRSRSLRPLILIPIESPYATSYQ